MLLVYAKIAPSPLHGFGLFAAQFIPAGALVWKVEPGLDVEISVEKYNTLPPPAQERIRHYAVFFPDEQKYLLSFDDDRFCNHSEDPNMIVRGDEGIFALRDVQPGEEITCCYDQVNRVWLDPANRS